MITKEESLKSRVNSKEADDFLQLEDPTDDNLVAVPTGEVEEGVYDDMASFCFRYFFHFFLTFNYFFFYHFYYSPVTLLSFKSIFIFNLF